MEKHMMARNKTLGREWNIPFGHPVAEEMYQSIHSVARLLTVVCGSGFQTYCRENARQNI